MNDKSKEGILIYLSFYVFIVSISTLGLHACGLIMSALEGVFVPILVGPQSLRVV